jgi:signal transduction histidine kinase
VPGRKRDEKIAVKASVGIRRKDNCRDWIELSVCDTDIGMTTEQQEKCRQGLPPFVSAAPGLGLAITRKLARMMGADVP